MSEQDQWDGYERRKRSRDSQDDHDSIIEFGVKIGNHSKAIETLATQNEKINQRIDFLYKVFWIGLGVGITIQFILRYAKGS